MRRATYQKSLLGFKLLVIITNHNYCFLFVDYHSNVTLELTRQTQEFPGSLCAKSNAAFYTHKHNCGRCASRIRSSTRLPLTFPIFSLIVTRSLFKPTSEIAFGEMLRWNSTSPVSVLRTAVIVLTGTNRMKTT